MSGQASFRTSRYSKIKKVASGGKIAWAIRKESPLLKASLNAFIKGHKVGTTFGNILKKKFYLSDTMVRRAYSPRDVQQFQRLVAIFRQFSKER